MKKCFVLLQNQTSDRKVKWGTRIYLSNNLKELRDTRRKKNILCDHKGKNKSCLNICYLLILCHHLSLDEDSNQLLSVLLFFCCLKLEQFFDL